MRIYKRLLLGLALAFGAIPAPAQGTFQDLDFESANVSGYPVGDSHVPVASALPGWNAFYTLANVATYPTTEVWRDGISLGGAIISVIDTNALEIGPQWGPLDGNYSAALFGGGTSSSISQTGLVPNGTKSLQAIMWWSVTGPTTAPTPIITLSGQPINMVLLASFPGYGLYGGDISSFAGQVAELTFTEPPPALFAPSMFFFDNIVFSPEVVPEPSATGLLALGSLLLIWQRRRN